MPRGFRLMLPFADWPTEDRIRWEAAFKPGDRFDENCRGTHLAMSTRQRRQESYGRFLRFVSVSLPRSLALPPEARINRDVVAQYASWRRSSCSDISVAVDLYHLHGVLKLICSDADWSWVLIIAKGIEAQAPRQPGKYHLVTSDRLYALGLELMHGAIARANMCLPYSQALQYRDGLMIALLALIPLRRRTFAALRLGHHLTKAGDHWELDIPAADTKSRRPLDYAISNELGARIDLYLERFRGHIPGADRHTGLWASKQRRPMCPDAIYLAVHQRTKEAFGFGVNMHRFRHAAASFWSSHDPVNVRGVKDLLGQASFRVTEKHYIMGQSRLAGRALARAIRNAGN